MDQQAEASRPVPLAVRTRQATGTNGKVDVSWSLNRDGARPILTFRWEELDGPHVVAPTKQGFGSQVIKVSFPGVRTIHNPDGLIFEMDVLVGQALTAQSDDSHDDAVPIQSSIQA
jgi:hypothetical protein